MRKNIGIWQFSGLVIVFSVGSFFHFLYVLTNFLPFAAISSVNESTFEHMKILFFPMLFFAVFQSFYFKNDYSNFWTIKLKGTLIGVIFIPVLFYTLTGFFGTLGVFVNISIFFVSILIAYLYETKEFKLGSKKCKTEKLSIIIFIILAVLCVLFTFFPPKIPLFLDPVTKTYGII